jgi:hypothetical protein
MNFECSVIRRVIWFARSKLERKETDIPTVLGWMDNRLPNSHVKQVCVA